jgi:hypothetical protein
MDDEQTGCQLAKPHYKRAPLGDANADAMERMKVNGDDLARLRDVDFTVVFPNVSAAKEFAEHFRSLGHRTSVEFSGTIHELPWDVVVVKNMALSQEDIDRFEETLQGVASSLHGRNDNWGCFSGS